MTFAGKRIVVTGAASGIGAALAHTLAAQGADVIGLDVVDGEGVHRSLDLADPASIDDAIAHIPGPLDGIANVAGLPGTHPPARILAVNLLGLRRLTEGLAPQLSAGGAVVCVSSVTADRCAWSPGELSTLLAMDWDAALAHIAEHAPDGTVAYEVSKKALNQWMLSTCAVLTPRGARINCVSPGPVETPILADFKSSIGEDRIAAAAALAGRHGRPDDIADVIAFLLSPTARWVNGVTLKVDGGFHGLREAKKLKDAA